MALVALVVGRMAVVLVALVVGQAALLSLAAAL